MSRVQGGWATKKPKKAAGPTSAAPAASIADTPALTSGSAISPAISASSPSSSSSSSSSPSSPSPSSASSSSSSASSLASSSSSSPTPSTASAASSLLSSGALKLREERVSQLLGEPVTAGQTILFSGAAEGADLFFGHTATAANVKVVHWSFPGHCRKRPAKAGQYVELNPTQLAEADAALKVAAKRLGKSPPSKPWVKQLLQRNYFQVRWVDAVYAVTWHDKDNPKSMLQVGGGTGWATQLYVDRFLAGETSQECRLFFFDVNTSVWRKWNLSRKAWDVLERVPPPSGWCAGIGTSTLIESGAHAITALFQEETKQPH